jgi:hypothetical protein
MATKGSIKIVGKSQGDVQIWVNPKGIKWKSKRYFDQKILGQNEKWS